VRRVKQIAKWTLIGAVGLLAVLAATVTLGFAWLRSDGGQDWLARQIEEAASTPGELELSIGEIDGALPQSLVARDIVVSDGEGAWLTIAAVEIDWRPWQLLRRTLAVERLALTRVALARLPAAPPEGQDEGVGSGLGDLLDFPLKIRLGRLAADEIALAQAVVGQAARLTLSGEAQRRDDGSLSAGLDFRRIDEVEGRLRAELRYQPRSDVLTAEIEAASARGGLLATLLDMPELPGAELELAGSGPLADWSGDFTLALGDLASAQADIGLMRSESGDLAFRLTGDSDVRPPADSDLWRLLAGRSTLDLAGAWQDGRRLQLDRLALGNDRLRLDLQGAVVPEDETLDLRLSAAADDAAALAPLAGLDSLRSLAAEIAVSGSFGQPQATLELRAAGVSSPDAAAESVVLTGTVTAERDLLGPAPLLALDLAGRLDAPRLPGQDAVNQVLGATLPVTLAGRLDLETLVLEVASFTATAGATTLSASGPFNLNDGSAELEAAAEAELATLQPLTEIALGGHARLAGPVTLAGFGSRIAADLKGRWEQPASDIGLVAAAAGDGLDLTTRLVIDGGDVRIEEATARSPTTDLKASLTVAGGGLHDGRYSLGLADAAALAGELGVATSGPATVEGAIAGPFDALEIGGRATLARLTVAEQLLTGLSGSYDLRLSGADIDGPVEVALSSPFGPAKAAADLRLRRDAVTLAGLRAELPETTVSGAVTVPLDGGAPAADLTGEVADLGPWLELAGFDGGGRGRLAVTLNQPGAAAPLTASADLTALTFRPQPGAAPVTAERLTVEAQGDDPSFSEPGRVDIVATALRWERLTLERTEVGARGTRSALDVTLDTQGQWIEPIELAAAAAVTQQGNTVTVALDRAGGRAFGQPLELRRPSTLTLAPAATRLQGLDLALGDARLTADAALDEAGIMVNAALEALPLAAVDAFWDSGLAGQLSAEVDLAGSLDDPRGSARLTASGLRPRDSKDTPPLQLTTSADWRDGRLQAAGELGGAVVAAARFSADAPLRMTADGGIEMPPRERLSGRLDWSGDVKTLLLFVPLPQHRLDGKTEVAVSVGGTAGAPQADGRITLAEGRYENLETGTILRNLAVTAELADQRVELASLSAVDGAGGKVTGSGGLALDSARNFPFDVAISLDKFHAVRRDDVTAVTSGKVKLDGDVTAPRVEGRFTTETVEISLLTDLPPTVVSLDVVEVKDGVVQQPPAAAEQATAVDAVLDIVVEMPRRVFVRGRGLDSEWAGRISVQGPAASPAVTGTLDLVRGQMSVVGKPFTLKAGKVTLPEGADSEPALDVTAVHEGKDLTVTARLSGPLSRPELELTSVPPVPRDEIVSRVLFNKSAAQLSAAEAAQLAIALRDLTGKGGGADILGFARRTLGVDVLRIETADEGDTPALEAGKYLTDEVYVGVKQGATSQSSSAGVEVELTPNITVESEVTGQGANKSGIRFHWDY
jgi:translocation and assembly module TamB